jgi:hypothetical protein
MSCVEIIYTISSVIHARIQSPKLITFRAGGSNPVGQVLADQAT